MAAAAKSEAVNNHRNGSSAKTVLTEDGPLRIKIPRDRDCKCEPVLTGRHEQRLTGFDDKIAAMYARGMTVREIQAPASHPPLSVCAAQAYPPEVTLDGHDRPLNNRTQ